LVSSSLDACPQAKSFLFRAQAAFLGRLSINSFYILLFFLSILDSRIYFSHSPTQALAIFTAFICAIFCYFLKNNNIYGKILYFITLVFDILLLTYITRDSGFLLSPFMAIHPFLTAIFLLLFHNPLLIITPLMSIPISTVLSIWGPHDPSLISIISVMTLVCMLNMLAIFFIHLVSGQEQHLTNSLLSAEKDLKDLAIEKERQRIAREFHDGAGARLTSIVMQCDLIKRQYLEPQHLIKEIDEISNSAVESLDDMRRSIAFLNKDFDITEQIIILCENMKLRHNLNIKINNINPLLKLNFEQQLACCRIVQEGLTNALKHASATEIKLSTMCERGGLCLSIEDNGCGFDTSIRRKHHFGLHNMQARARQIGGELSYWSGNNQGTTIRLYLLT